MERRLTHLNWMDIRDRQEKGITRVLLPVGSLEAHGALAQGTDIFASEYFCSRLAEPLDALIAPCVPYGVTRSLSAYPGTLHIEPDAFGAYVTEIFRSFARQGFEEILVLNGHGGHSQLLRETAGEAHEETGARIGIVDWWTECYDLCEPHLGVPGGHAGADEGAVMRAVDPSLVFPERESQVKGAVMRPSYAAFPAAGSLLSQSQAGLTLVHDADKCAAYVEAAVFRIGDVFRRMLDGWGALD